MAAFSGSEGPGESATTGAAIPTPAGRESDEPPRPASRRVLLTGASSGIGREVALHLARDGHRLALASRRRPALEETRAACAAPSQHAVIPVDLTSSPAVSEAVARAQDQVGPLDTLVHCAGTALFGNVEETTDEIWRQMLEDNLSSLFHTVRSVIPLFRREGRGHIVALLSIASRRGFPGSSAYTAAKFGALGFLESVRAEVRGEGIHVTTVFAGATDTPLWDRLGDQWDRARMMAPEQVARVIAAVLRDTSSGMVEEIQVGPVGGAL